MREIMFKKIGLLFVVCLLSVSFASVALAEISVVAPEKAAKAVGPYSHGIVANGFVFVSGQLPMDAKGVMAEGIEAQTKQSLENVKMVLEAAGSSMAKVVKVTVFMKDLNEFAKMNAVYGTFFDAKNYPARATVQAARIPKDALVEIEVIAVK